MFHSLYIAITSALLYSSVLSRCLPDPSKYHGYIEFDTITGYFLQDDPSTNSTTFNFTSTNFGLINRTYPDVGSHTGLTQWQQFAQQVEALNEAAPTDTVYKVLFMGRHGEGYHNAAQTYYGTPGWNCYWAELNGNGTTSWHDAELDAAGIAQALSVNAFWKHEIAVQKIPYPQSYYTSPLTRCLQTANLTFSGLKLPEYHPFIPTVKELLREGISIHTCDQRRSKSYIHNLFPTWTFDDDFSQFDTLWDGVTAESTDAQAARSKKWLDQVFATDDHTYLSITSHSGEIGSTLSVLGHQPFPLSTGAVIPVLVRAQFLPKKDAPATTSWAWTTSTHCAKPPKTSISTLAQGCVCPGGKQGAVTTPLVHVTNTNVAGPTAYPGPDYKRI